MAAPRRRNSAPTTLRDVVARIEEVLVASTAADPWAEAVKLVAALAVARRERLPASADTLPVALAHAREAFPELASSLSGFVVPRDVLETCTRLAAPFVATESDLAFADAAFEEMTSRRAKAEKGQFFTPRHVVELAVRLAAPKDGETVVDPSAGSAAFLWHAAAGAKVTVHGIEIDPRAAIAARLLLRLAGANGRIDVGDGLRAPLPEADVVLSNPPFAGEVVDPDVRARFELGAPRVERDVLFLERAVSILRPGGRLAIVVPHGLVADDRTAHVRDWLLRHARIHCVVGLSPTTFMPHTGQRTALVVAERRERTLCAPPARERIFFAVSERSGLSRRGAPLVRAKPRSPSAWDTLDHDFAEIAEEARSFREASA